MHSGAGRGLLCLELLVEFVLCVCYVMSLLSSVARCRYCLLSLGVALLIYLIFFFVFILSFFCYFCSFLVVFISLHFFLSSLVYQNRAILIFINFTVSVLPRCASDRLTSMCIRLSYLVCFRLDSCSSVSTAVFNTIKYVIRWLSYRLETLLLMLLLRSQILLYHP